MYIVKYVIPRVSFEERSRTINVKNKRSTFSKLKLFQVRRKKEKLETPMIFCLIFPNLPEKDTRQNFVLFFEREKGNERNQRDKIIVRHR